MRFMGTRRSSEKNSALGDLYYHPRPKKKELKIMKRYHEWRQKARIKYLNGYYRGHQRMPNVVVLILYEIGYFFADFIPLIMNLIEGVYRTVKNLISFVIGLLVEASIFIVLIGAALFSIAHSLDRLRSVGATGGLEYLGVLMFEVIFLGAGAMLTQFLTQILTTDQKPEGFIVWFGIVLTAIGFLVGLTFVWWSNTSEMAPTMEGWLIGSAVPFLALIGQGILVCKHAIEKHTIKQRQKRKLEYERSSQRNGENSHEVVLGSNQNPTENGTKTVEHNTENTLKNGTEINNDMVPVVTEKPVTENGTETNRNMVEKTVEDATEKAVENDTGKDGVKLEKSTVEEIQEVPENETKQVPESDEKTVTEMVEKDAKNEDESNQNTNQKPVEKISENTTKINTETNTKTDAKNGTEIELNEDKKTVLNDTEIKQENGIKETKNKTKKSTKRTKVDPDAKKIKQAAKRWAKRYFKEKGKIPGRVRIQKNVEKCNQSIARDVVEELKKEIKVS
jgi:hypothetical protein